MSNTTDPPWEPIHSPPIAFILVIIIVVTTIVVGAIVIASFRDSTGFMWRKCCCKQRSGYDTITL